MRQEPDGIQTLRPHRHRQLQPDTAKVYTDIGLFTADRDIVADVSEIFNYLTGYSNQKEFRSLLVAPRAAADAPVGADRARGGARARRPDARIIIKVNAITDDQMIRVLLQGRRRRACRSDLIVRGICGLRPGIPGVSDNIRVRSIVGRFLEHSRIYWFLNGGHDEMYIGSADLMERNLDRRVETLTPVRDPEILRTSSRRRAGRLPARHRSRDGARLDRPLHASRRRVRQLQCAGVPAEALRRRTERITRRSDRPLLSLCYSPRRVAMIKEGLCATGSLASRFAAS